MNTIAVFIYPQRICLKKSLLIYLGAIYFYFSRILHIISV